MFRGDGVANVAVVLQQVVGQPVADRGAADDLLGAVGAVGFAGEHREQEVRRNPVCRQVRALVLAAELRQEVPPRVLLVDGVTGEEAEVLRGQHLLEVEDAGFIFVGGEAQCEGHGSVSTL